MDEVDPERTYHPVAVVLNPSVPATNGVDVTETFPNNGIPLDTSGLLPTSIFPAASESTVSHAPSIDTQNTVPRTAARAVSV